MPNLVDIVLVEKDFDFLRLLLVPSEGGQVCFKLGESDIATHPNTVLLDKLLETALVVLEGVLLVTDEIFEELERGGADLADQIKVAHMLHKTVSDHFDEVVAAIGRSL